jgi:hypothetical protein
MSKATAEQVSEREHCTQVLRDWLSEGDYVGTVCVHGRGSTDWVECFLPSVEYDGRPTVNRVTYYVARAIGYTGSLEKGIALRGYQYDKANDVVDSLSRVLFGEGGKLHRNRLLG